MMLNILTIMYWNDIYMYNRDNMHPHVAQLEDVVAMYVEEHDLDHDPPPPEDSNYWMRRFMRFWTPPEGHPDHPGHFAHGNALTL